MISTFIDRLGGLLPKYFIFSSFVPVLVYATVNSLLLYYLDARFRAFIGPFSTLSDTAAPVLSLFVGAIVIAYVMSTVGVYLREVLEGRHLWWHFGPLRLTMMSYEQRRLDEILRQLEEARNESRKIVRGKKKWLALFDDEQSSGGPKQHNSVEYDASKKASTSVNALRAIRAESGSIHYDQLERAVTELAAVYHSNISHESKSLFQSDYLELLRLIDYAVDRWAERESDCYRESSSAFGPPSLAPTRIGNIAASMQAYAVTRYGLDLGSLWSRISIVFQSKETYYGGLLDAKTQLDFLVTCWWLTIITFAVWFILLALNGFSLVMFLVVSFIGPVIAYVLYMLVGTNYLAFADLVRSGVDLYRFDLLTSLHVRLPQSLDEEKELWQKIQRIASFGEPDQHLSYQHDVT
jgi:hypothetical protein